MQVKDELHVFDSDEWREAFKKSYNLFVRRFLNGTLPGHDPDGHASWMCGHCPYIVPGVYQFCDKCGGPRHDQRGGLMWGGTEAGAPALL